MKAAMFFAEGFEEVEALATVDVLRRGGVEVKMISIANEKSVTGAHDITIEMNGGMDEVNIEELDALLLPGGMPGTNHLKACEELKKMLVQAAEGNKVVGAICAAPIVLGACGLLKNKKATCYPGFEDQLTGATAMIEKVVVDGNVITSRGVGTALDFGLAILSQLTDSENAKKIKESIIYS